MADVASVNHRITPPMPSIEFRGRADRAVGDQLADIRRWLDDNAVRATDLQARVLHARVTFTATFKQAADAERFIKELVER